MDLARQSKGHKVPLYDSSLQHTNDKVEVEEEMGVEMAVVKVEALAVGH